MTEEKRMIDVKDESAQTGCAETSSSKLPAEQGAPADKETGKATLYPKNWLANFMPLFIGQVLSLIGSAVVQFALIWYLTEQTGSAAVLATASLVGLLPQVILGPFAGALVDRWNRKLTMVVSDLIVMLATVVLIVLFATGQIENWHIYLILFTRAMAGIFQGPALSASITLLIPPDQYTRFGGLNQALNGTINIVAPPLGALLMALWPTHNVLMVDVVTAILAISMLFFLVKVPQPPKSEAEELVTPKTVLKDVVSAFMYLKGWSGMWKLTMIAALINFALAPSGSLTPLLITKHFGGGAGELAAAQSAMGIGIVIGGLALGVWGGFKRKVLTTLAGIIVMGVGFLGTGLTPGNMLPVAIGFNALTGMAIAFANGPLGAIFQAKIPPEMQGRAFMMLNSLCMLAMPIGIALAAPIADHLAVNYAFIFGGIIVLGMGVAGLLQKDVYTLDSQEVGGKAAPVTAE